MNTFEQLLKIVEEQPLSRSLTVTLRIASMIADVKLTSWIKLELMGYLKDNPELKEETVVPEYRSVPGQWYDDYGRPFVINDGDLSSLINEMRLRQGVAELEGIATARGPMVMRPTGFPDIIREQLHVEVSVFQFQPHSITQVLTNIRMRLLEQITIRRDKIMTLPLTEVATTNEIVQLKPSFHGVSIDLKELWRRIWSSKNM